MRHGKGTLRCTSPSQLNGKLRMMGVSGRKYHRLRVDHDVADAATTDGPEARVLVSEDVERIAAILTPHQARALSLQVEGHSGREIALRLGVAHDCVRQQIKRARERLAQGLCDYARGQRQRSGQNTCAVTPITQGENCEHTA
jgi:DNA-directed RNA polymerase specialized sigma24 family protein